MKLKLLFTSCLLFALPVLVIAGPSVTKWKVKDPFEQKVFIENKGQFAIPTKNIVAGDVLYGARLGGLQYYFTKNSIWISQQAPVKRTDAEIAQLKSEAGTNLSPQQEKTLEYRYVEEFHQVNFIDADPTAKISAVNEVSNYFTYGMGGNTSVKANAYKKIIYTGIYPGIDMEVYFPLDKTGYEYDFIVHPGADPSQIKIQYPLNEGISLNGDGNIVVTSVYGDFTEHTPIANQAETANAIACSFALNQNVVQFKTGNYDRGNTLKIDPWVNPTLGKYLTGVDAGYDVDWDNGSNCYVYGGSFPWELVKFGPSGNYLWTYTPNFPSSSGNQYFGDFAVDRFSKSVYITEGLNTGGANIAKLNSAGGLIIQFSGNSTMPEMWRISFSRCVPHQAVVGGGNGLDAPFNSAFLLNPTDSSLNSITPVNVLSTTTGYHDVGLLTLDDAPTPNAYMGFAESTVSSTDANSLIKVSTSALTTIDWNVYDNYGFIVANSILFAEGNGGDRTLPNGFEGITYSELEDLYTYDSWKLERWNTTSGAMVSTVVNTPRAGHSNASMYWSGLTSNTCNDIFLGTGDNIQEYDSSLATVGAPISEGDTVYSVKVGDYNLLYACGQNFVTVIQLDVPYCLTYTAPAIPNNATCTTEGSIAITPTGGTSPYNFILRDSLGVVVLNTRTGQDSALFSGLAPGQYIVDVTDSSCLSERVYDTVKIRKIATYSPGKVTPPNPVAICYGSSVVLNASLAQSYSWRDTTGKGYPVGLSDSSGNSVTANPTATTTYDCIARTNGDCPDTIKVIVDVNPLPQIIVSPDSLSVCTAGSITLTASGAVTYTWAPTTGLSSGVGTSVKANPVITTTYTVTGTDANTCVNDTTVVVNVYPYPVVTASPADTICVGKSATLVANGAITYTWTPSTGLSATTGSSVTASPTNSTTYSVSGTSHGCTTTPATLDSVTVNPLPTIAIAGLSPLYCINNPAVVLNGGTPAGGAFSGTGVTYVPDTTFNPSTAGAGTFPITYTYTNSFGCTNSADTMVTVAPLPVLSILPVNPVICSGLPITLTAIGASTYVWAPSGSTDSTTVVEIATPTRYSVTGTDTNGCMDTVSALVGIGTLPDTGFVMNTPSECNALSVIFLSTDTTVLGTNYLWKFGDGTTSTLPDPAHTYSMSDTLSVTLYLTNAAGCEDSTKHEEHIVSTVDIAVFPNAFLPDNPKYAQDAEFGPEIMCSSLSGYVFRVYNRWGQEVFSTNDQTEGWDGRFNASEEPVGVYVYYMQCVCGGCSIQKQGNVTLLR